MPISIHCSVTHKNEAEKAKIKLSALKKMVGQIAILLETAATRKNKENMRAWFGAWNQDRNAERIHTRLNQLIAYVNGATLAFKTRDGKSGIAYADLKSKAPVIFLQRPFRYQRIIWGEKVVSIVHELAHKCEMKALDIGSTYYSSGMSSGDCYGPKNAKALAALNNDNAIKNAENWGYYVCSYASAPEMTAKAGHQAGDWAFGALSQGGVSKSEADDPRIVGQEPPPIPKKTSRPPTSTLKKT